MEAARFGAAQIIAMRFSGILGLSAIGALQLHVAAQFPAQPEGITVLESQVEDGARISYKEASQFLQRPSRLLY